MNDKPSIFTKKQQIGILAEMKVKAIEQFVRRKRYAAQIEKVDNAGLHAGEPMYFYCECCNIPTEVLPEDYLFPPIRQCSQCAGLKQEGWLEEAMNSKE